jgi:glutaminase
MADDHQAFPSPITRILEGLLGRYHDCREGDVATYIPELAKADPDTFGICVATIDGHVYEVGDSRHRFTIQSISKPFVYGLALDDHGVEAMARKVGVEPSGDAFNAISLRADDGRPFNPMINAGAIATTGQVTADDPASRLARILDMFRRHAGRPFEVDMEVYESEARTGHRNRAIGHLLRNYDVLSDDPTPVVDVYFRQCSILVDCHDLALMAATLANQGVNPVTKERAVRAENVESVLSVMASCGMYDSSGGWIHDVGMPAKSGVGGGVLAVLPGQFGIGVFSPRLDRQGNSVRAVRVCAELSKAWELHQFNPPYCPQTSRRHAYSCAEKHSTRSRHAREADCLRHHGTGIRVFEVQGSLSVATTEPIVREIVDGTAGMRSLLIDFQHATGINASAASLLADLANQLCDRGIRVLFTHAARLPELSRVVAERLGTAAAADVLHHQSLDSGLEACENDLLRDHLPDLAQRVIDLSEYELAAGMDDAERAVLASLLTVRRYGRGESIVREGAEAHSLFLLAKGVVGVWTGGGAENARRVAGFSPGTMIGVMAFVDDGPRSATFVADDDVECDVFERADFERLQSTHPAIYAKILRNIAVSLAAKLRLTNAHLEVVSTRR